MVGVYCLSIYLGGRTKQGLLVFRRRHPAEGERLFNDFVDRVRSNYKVETVLVGHESLLTMMALLLCWI